MLVELCSTLRSRHQKKKKGTQMTCRLAASTDARAHHSGATHAHVPEPSAVLVPLAPVSTNAAGNVNGSSNGTRVSQSDNVNQDRTAC